MGFRVVAASVLRGGMAILAIALLTGLILAAVWEPSEGWTGLYLALVFLDPDLAKAVAESLGVAGAVAVVALLAGLMLARAIRHPGAMEASFEVFLSLPLLVPPALMGVGLLGWWHRYELEAESYAGWCGRLTWAWAELTWAVPLVCARVLRDLRRIDPLWEDVARQVGGRRLLWRALLWPLVWPTALRNAVQVFALILLEPGVPLVLGVRSSLAYQVIESIRIGGSIPRAASLALLACSLGWTPTLLLAMLRRRDVVRGLDRRVSRGPRSVPLPRRAIALATMALWAFFWGFSSGGLIITLIRQVGAVQLKDPTWDVHRLLGYGFRSLVLGMGVSVVGLAMRLLGPGSSGIRASSIAGRILTCSAATPSLALAVGFLASGAWLGDWIGPAIGFGPSAALGEPIGALSGVALLVILSNWPAFGYLAFRIAEGWNSEELETARLLGATRAQGVRSIILPRILGPLTGSVAVMTVRAGLVVSSAVLLTPTLGSRPVGPGLIDLVMEPDGLREAAWLALMSLGLALVAAGVGARTGVGRLVSSPVQ